jgi:hypothetical protein
MDVPGARSSQVTVKLIYCTVAGPGARLAVKIDDTYSRERR